MRMSRVLALEGFLVDLEGADEVVEVAGLADRLGVGVDDLGVGLALEDVGLLLALALDLLDLGLVLLMISFFRCSPSLMVLVAIASISDTARSKAASRTCGDELDPRQADVHQLDAAAPDWPSLLPSSARACWASCLIWSMILSRPSETDSRASGGTTKSGMACSRSLAGRVLSGARGPVGRGGGDHLGGKPEGVGHLAVGAADDLGRLCVVIVSRAVLRTNSLTRDSAFGTVRRVCTNWTGSVIRQTAQTVTSTFLPSAVGHVDQLVGLASPVPDLERLGQPQHFLDQGAA